MLTSKGLNFIKHWHRPNLKRFTACTTEKLNTSSEATVIGKFKLKVRCLLYSSLYSYYSRTYSFLMLFCIYYIAHLNFLIGFRKGFLLEEKILYKLTPELLEFFFKWWSYLNFYKNSIMKQFWTSVHLFCKYIIKHCD